MTQGPQRPQEQTGQLRVQGVDVPSPNVGENPQFPEAVDLPDNTSEKFQEVVEANNAAFDAVARANEAVAQAEMADAQAEGFSQGGQQLAAALGKIANTFSIIQKRQAKEEAAEREIRQEKRKLAKERNQKVLQTQAKNALRQEIRNMQTTIREKGIEEGVQQFREQGRQILNRAKQRKEITPEALDELSQTFHQELNQVQEDRAKHSVQQMRNTRDQMEQIQTEKARIQISSTLAKLENVNDPDRANELVDQAITQINQFTPSRQEDPQAFANVALPLLSDLANSASASADARQAALQKRKQLQNYANEAAPIYDQYNQGKISGDQMEFKLKRLGLKHGVPEAAGDVFRTDTEKLQEANDRRETIRKAKEMATRDDTAISTEMAKEVSDVQIGRLIQGYVTGDTKIRTSIELGLRNDNPLADVVKSEISAFQDDRQKYRQLQEQLWSTNTDIKEQTGIDIKQIVMGGEDGDTIKAQPVYDETAKEIILPRVTEQVKQLVRQREDITEEDARAALEELKRRRERTLKEMAHLNNKWSQRGLNVRDPNDSTLLEEKEAKVKPVLDRIKSTPSNLRQRNMDDQGIPNPNKGGAWKPDTPQAATLAEQNGVKLPFQKKDEEQIRITSTYGPRESPTGRGEELHNGVDFAAKLGTPVSTPQGGRVLAVQDIPGFGKSVLVKTPDGHTEQFSHLGETTVQAGQKVAPGQTIGEVGKSGNATGPVLHFQVWQGDPQWGDRETQHSHTFDPQQYLNLIKQQEATPRHNGPPPNQQMPGGDSAAEQPAPASQRPIHQQRNKANPYRRDKAPHKRQYYELRTEPRSNHGYEALKNDQRFAEKLNAEANRAGIPGQWLADIVALNTGGSFRPDVKAPDQRTRGLMQVGDEATEALGRGQEAIENMSREEQLEMMSDYLRAPGVGEKIRDLDDTFAAIWGGRKALDTPKKERRFLHDGSRSFEQYMQLLGNHVGRRYHTPFERRKRSRQKIHTNQVEGCQLCNQMLNQNGAIVPHYAD